MDGFIQALLDQGLLLAVPPSIGVVWLWLRLNKVQDREIETFKEWLPVLRNVESRISSVEKSIERNHAEIARLADRVMPK